MQELFDSPTMHGHGRDICPMQKLSEVNYAWLKYAQCKSFITEKLCIYEDIYTYPMRGVNYALQWQKYTPNERGILKEKLYTAMTEIQSTCASSIPRAKPSTAMVEINTQWKKHMTVKLCIAIVEIMANERNLYCKTNLI